MLGHVELDLVPEQVADVLDAVLDHGRPLQRQAPRNDAHAVRQAHRPQHLWPEDARVADFCPLLEVWVVAEDLHGGLRVRVEGGLEAQVCDTDALEELGDDADQVAQRQVVIRHHALHLVELSKVRCVQRLVAEDAVDGEELDGLEAARLVGHLVQHACRDGRRVRAQQVLHGLVPLPVIPVAHGAEAAALVHRLHGLQVLLRDRQRRRGILNEERVVHVAARVRLRLEQRVEVPEGALHEAVGRHLLEAAAQETR